MFGLLGVLNTRLLVFNGVNNLIFAVPLTLLRSPRWTHPNIYFPYINNTALRCSITELTYSVKAFKSPYK